jgi:hypothetical protein
VGILIVQWAVFETPLDIAPGFPVTLKPDDPLGASFLVKP